MKKTDNQMIIQPRGEITNRQTPLTLALQEMHPVPRLAFGLIGCAAIAVYAPMLLLTFTGNWLNSLIGATGINLILVSVLALVTLIANKFGRVMLVSIILALAFDLYWTSLAVRIYSAHDWWANSWANYFDVTTAFLLNGYLFSLYKKAADL